MEVFGLRHDELRDVQRKSSVSRNHKRQVQVKGASDGRLHDPSQLNEDINNPYIESPVVGSVTGMWHLPLHSVVLSIMTAKVGSFHGHEVAACSSQQQMTIPFMKSIEGRNTSSSPFVMVYVCVLQVS